jgi:hypothetical protein
VSAAATGTAAVAGADPAAGDRPIVPPEIEERFLAPARAVGDRSRLVYRPRLLAQCRLHFVRTPSAIDRWEDRTLVAEAPAADGAITWRQVASSGVALESAPREGATFAAAPALLLRAKSWSGWRKQLETVAYRDHKLVLWSAAALDAQSTPGESEADFRARLAHLARERRDRAVEELRRRYAPKLAAIEDKVRRGQERVEREQSQLGRERLDTVISIGATIAGALFGRKLASVTNVTRARSTIRGATRATQEKDDVARAERGLTDARQDAAALERSLDPTSLAIDRVEVAARKTDIEVTSLVLLWTPWRVDASGVAEPLFDE